MGKSVISRAGEKKQTGAVSGSAVKAHRSASATKMRERRVTANLRGGGGRQAGREGGRKGREGRE